MDLPDPGIELGSPALQADIVGLVPDYGNDITLKQVTQLFGFPGHIKVMFIVWKVKVNESHSVVFDSLRPHGLYSPWNSLGQNIGVGILPNPGLLHCRRILYQLSHKGSPEILECVTYPFSSGSSRPRN